MGSEMCIRDRSTIIVAGGSSAFIDVADTVIAMEDYQPHDVTEKARALAEDVDEQADFSSPQARVVTDLRVNHGKRKKRPQAKIKGEIRHGKDSVDISAVEQVVSGSQAAGIARALGWVEDHLDGHTTLAELASESADHTADLIHGSSHPGALVQPRALEVAFALSRHRGLKI